VEVEEVEKHVLEVGFAFLGTGGLFVATGAWVGRDRTLSGPAWLLVVSGLLMGVTGLRTLL